MSPYLCHASFPLPLVPFSILLSIRNRSSPQNRLADPKCATQWRLAWGRKHRSLSIRNDCYCEIRWNTFLLCVCALSKYNMVKKMWRTSFYQHHGHKMRTICLATKHNLEQQCSTSCRRISARNQLAKKRILPPNSMHSRTNRRAQFQPIANIECQSQWCSLRLSCCYL